MNSQAGAEGMQVGEDFSLPLFAAAAHELKAPLALIRNLAQTIERGDCSEREVAELAERIRLTSERSLRQAQDLALSQRLELSYFETEPINPVALSEEVAHELAPLFAAHGRELRVVARARPPLVVANRQMMRSILTQFADNALHYAEGDHPVEFVTQAARTGQSVRVAVRDYGPALAPDVWQRLRLLGRTPQPITRRPQSSGLGLYVARQFAEAMQSEIGMIRHRDGASFYLLLPGSIQTSLL